MEEKDKILDLTEEKICKDGFYKTTMAELASDLTMSKKTIYKYFPSKNHLVEAILKRFMKNRQKDIFPLLNSNKNAVEKFAGLIFILSKNLSKLSEKMLNDVRIHFPTLWKELEKFRTEMINENLSKVVEQGKREGLISDYPTPIIMTIFLASIRSVVNPDFIIENNFSANQAAQITFRILMSGILTEKGLKIFKKSISENIQ